MSRLPKPGSDSGTWGDILNDYLSQSHTSDGKLKTDSVTASQLAPSSVQGATIANNAITNTKLVDGAVTESKITDGSVTNTKLADGSVTDSKLAPNSITNTKILDGTITNSKLDPTLAATINATLPSISLENYTLATAITQITTNGGGEILVPVGTYTMTANATIPANCSLRFIPGSLISTTGYTLTINGQIDAGVQQVFTGSGAVAGTIKNNDIYPQWFGAVGNGSTDDYTALNALITTIGSISETIRFPRGTYKLSTSIIIPSNIVLEFENGAILSPDSAKTVTINGEIKAGLYRIFTGVGVIRGTIKNKELYPQWWGALGDNSTDNSAAFIALDDYLSYSYNNNPSAGYENGAVTVYIPAGKYKFLSDSVNILSRVYQYIGIDGITFKGAGRAMTCFYFNPVSNNEYLFINGKVAAGDGADARGWKNLTFEDISFYGTVAKTTNFMYTHSEGTASNYVFNRCNFHNFKYGFEMTGTNLNSEMTFFHCGIYGDTTSFLHSASGYVNYDQFLNYNFFSCQCEIDSGGLIELNAGGNINIWGGSFIHIGTVGGTFFKLLGNAHANGVERFLCIGTRFEHRNVNSKLIECEWSQGAVSFINIDQSSQISVTSLSTTLATFKSINVKMPSIKFDNCMLAGVHEYTYGSNSTGKRHAVVYDNCEFYDALTPNTFIVLTPISGTLNIGGSPNIHFKNCVSRLSDTENWDTDYNWKNCDTGVLTKKYVSLKNPTAEFPIDTQYLYASLPLGCIITKVTIYSPANGTVGGSTWNVDFTLQTTETTPTVLAQAFLAGAEQKGFHVSEDLFFLCDSDTKRKVRMYAGTGVDQYNYKAVCLIEYLG